MPESIATSTFAPLLLIIHNSNVSSEVKSAAGLYISNLYIQGLDSSTIDNLATIYCNNIITQYNIQ